MIQTYWPQHPAVQAAAGHDPEVLLAHERLERERLGYPPFGRLVNLLLTGADGRAVRLAADALADSVRDRLPDGAVLLGPSPAPLAKVKDAWRWHLLVKLPRGVEPAPVLRPILDARDGVEGVALAVDVDPLDLL